jgi:hypothetical protein
LDGYAAGVAEPQTILAERWHGDLAYLRVPEAERDRWRLAPDDMSYAQAHCWARDVVHAEKVILLSTGETLVRLRQPAASPWSL